MSLNELDSHLKLLVSAKFSMEKLASEYYQSSNDMTNEFNNKINRVSRDYKEFVQLSRHPNEISYFRKYGKLPEKVEIYFSSKRFGLGGMFLSFIARIIIINVFDHIRIANQVLGNIIRIIAIVISLLCPAIFIASSLEP